MSGLSYTHSILKSWLLFTDILLFTIQKATLDWALLGSLRKLEKAVASPLQK